MLQPIALVGAFGSQAAACTLALGLNDEEPCATNGDCVYSSGQGLCINSVCVPPSSDSETTDSTSEGPDPTSTSTDGLPEASCTRNTDCSMDERCGPDNTCLRLLSAECQQLEYPATSGFDRDKVVYVGSIMPFGGAFSNTVQPLVNAIQLAIEDFNAETTLQGDRQVAWLSCESTGGEFAAAAAAQHLVTNAGAPAIIGPAFSESVLAAAEDVTIAAGTFLITPSATAVSITEVPDNDLVWRSIAPDSYQANAFIDRAVTLRGLTDPDTRLERVLLLAKDDEYGVGLRALVEGELTRQLPGVPIWSLTYADPAGLTSEQLLSAYGATVASAFDQLPQEYAERDDHYTDVLLLGTAETQSLLYAYLTAWDGLQTGDPQPDMPRFIFSHGSVPDLVRFVNEIGAATNTEALEPHKQTVNDSIEGISPIIFDPENFNSFNIRYRIRFNKQDAVTSSSLSYDATLAALFAMSTIAGGTEITGARIAAAMPRLMDPEGVSVSFSGSTLGFITQARNALVVEGGTVDLHGVSGELTWDSAGDIRTDLVGWRLDDADPSTEVDPQLTEARRYTLNSPPATDGTWGELSP